MECSVRDVLHWLAPVGGRLANGDSNGLADGFDHVRIGRPAELARSHENEIAFFFSKNYQTDLMTAAPGILITGEPFLKPLQASGLPLWKKTAVIACNDPYLGMALCLEKLAPSFSSVVHEGRGRESVVHPSAIVSPEASIGRGVQVGAGSVVESGVRVGEDTIIYPGCYLGDGVNVGRNCVLFPKVTLYERTIVGDSVRIHAGVVLGADGFGYAPVRGESGQPAGHRKIFHLGRVIVGDEVEIGANTCIDRGTLGDTKVDRFAKIDDLVMVGHNCWIEEGAVLCGKAGLAGRARVGRYALIGGAAGLSNDVHVGDGARVGGHCLVSKDVPAGATVVGNPQREHQEHFRVQAMLNRMIAGRRKDRGGHEAKS